MQMLRPARACLARCTMQLSSAWRARLAGQDLCAGVVEDGLAVLEQRQALAPHAQLLGAHDVQAAHPGGVHTRPGSLIRWLAPSLRACTATKRAVSAAQARDAYVQRSEEWVGSHLCTCGSLRACKSSCLPPRRTQHPGRAPSWKSTMQQATGGKCSGTLQPKCLPYWLV